jgi:hypothetical protein
MASTEALPAFKIRPNREDNRNEEPAASEDSDNFAGESFCGDGVD